MKPFLHALASAGMAMGLASAGQAALVVNGSTIGQPVIVAADGEVIATYVGDTAFAGSNLFVNSNPDVIFTNGVSLPGDTKSLGFFTAGTELIFRLEVGFSGDIFYSGAASRNLDGLAHAAANSDGGFTFVGFEDLFGGGDGDYDDLVFSFSNTLSGPVPEPASWAMMIGGFALAGSAMRRRKVAVRFA